MTPSTWPSATSGTASSERGCNSRSTSRMRGCSASIDQIVTINDRTGSFDLSTANITTPQLESMYFQPLVSVTPDSLAADVRSALDSGQITKAGVASTLLSDLNAASAARSRGQCKTAANIYQQFINDVAAQAGKSIAPDTARQLTREAENLEGSCP